VPAQAAELLLFATQMPLHFGQRFRRIDNREIAAAFHLFDFFEDLQKFTLRVIDQPAVAKAEIAAGQRSQRITERAAFEAQGFKKCREPVIIVNQPARRDAGGGLDAGRMEEFVGAFDFRAVIRQAAVLLVFGNIVRVNGHDHAAQAVAGEAAHIFLSPKPPVGANHRMNPALRRVARHGPQIAMHHRFAANEQQIADVIFYGDVNDVTCFLQRYALPGFGIKLGAGKTAEIAVRIANVRDGELQVTRPTVI